MQNQYIQFLRSFDRSLLSLTSRFGVPTLRLALAVVFIWFGGLKAVGLSPAGELVAATVYWLTPEIIVPLLGLWEVAIGICLLFPPLLRVGLLLLALQIPGTFLPLILLPEVCFTFAPLGLTLEGQYIVKNLVIIGSAFVLGSSLAPLSEKEKS